MAKDSQLLDCLFYFNIRVVLKELRESRCWLHLIEISELLPGDSELSWLLDESTQLCNIVGQSVATASQKRNHRKPKASVSDRLEIGDLTAAKQ